ncbi:MAG: DUF5011 domain-containing protein [Oscillospiraceae bacterium]|nr:DUF5011 domain-containing protein [Oscillospiraceae bacterium]
MKKKVLFAVFSAVFILAVAGGMVWALWNHSSQLSLQLKGEREIFLEYGQSYDEPGYTAQYTEGDTTENVEVTIRGQVDTSKPGKYRLKYIARYENTIRTDYRYVHIVDNEAPEITLTKVPGAYTLIGETYQEEGFTATDNYDGDLTKWVTCKETDGIMTYTVTDSSGNTTTVSRTINYVDPSAPILQLVGGEISFIMAGENYAEPGCSAMDLRDGDLSSEVIVSGDVDADIPGIYTLNYSVTNSFGGTSSMDRIIYVIPRQQNEEDKPTVGPDTPPEENIITGGTTIEPNGKTIYLTFDDGPSAHTERLLDVLKKYGVKVTFFVKNSNYLSMLTRAAEEGHTVAIHTYTHDYAKVYASDQAYYADLQAIQNVIYEYTGQKSMLMRFPGGSSNGISRAYNKGIMTRLTKGLEAMGYQYFDWNVDSNDAGGARTAEEVFKNVTKGIGSKQNSVVLQHDTQSFSVDAVERIIAWGLCNGYTFKALTHDSPTCHHGVIN